MPFLISGKDLLPKPYFQDDAITIYHGDSRVILPQLTVKADLLLTDPPYGIKYSTEKSGYPGIRRFPPMVGDKDLDAVQWLLTQVETYPTCIIWGAHCFPHLLPFPGVWLCWDKRVIDEADAAFGWPFELAWVSKRQGKAHIYRVQHGGAVNADGANMPRMHPTQKPVALFKRIILDYDGQVILDPFMGSGATLRAAKDLGRKAIGIEIEERYCEVAAKRMAQGVLL